MGPEGLIIIAAGAGGTSVIAGLRMLRDRPRRGLVRRLRDVPVASADAAEGTLVKITGTVGALDDQLVAPLSGKRCVIYRATLRIATETTRSTLGAVAEAAAVSFASRPFLVDTGPEGVVIVDGAHAELDLPAVPARRFDDERVLRFKLQHGLAPLASPLVAEVIVEPGTRLTVAGFVLRDLVDQPPSDELGFRDTPRGRLRLTGSRDHPLLVSQPRTWHELPRWFRA